MKAFRPSLVLRKALDRVGSLRLARHVRVEAMPGLTRLGTAYGGYVVPEHLPQPDWICYSGGIGEDASFELEMIARYGCDVVGFDPTPRAIRYMQQVATGTPRFRFLPVGLWSSDVEQRFYAPNDPEHVSHSVTNTQQTDQYFVAQCRSVPSLMTELGHERLDLLKLDVEGAEDEVLRSVLKANVRVKMLIVELHSARLGTNMISMVDQLQAAGYRPIHLDHTDLTLVEEGLVA